MRKFIFIIGILLLNNLIEAQDFSFTNSTHNFKNIYIFSPKNTKYNFMWQVKNNSIVYFEEGDYFISSVQIFEKKNIAFIGKGKVSFLSKDPYGYIFHLSESTNIIIRNIHFEHVYPNGEKYSSPKPLMCKGNAIDLTLTQNIVIENCDINGSGVVGISPQKCKCLLIKNNKIHKNSTAGVKFDGASQGIWLLNNIFYNNSSDIQIGLSDISENISSADGSFQIEGNIFTNIGVD